jgi:hypothetical protein
VNPPSALLQQLLLLHLRRESRCIVISISSSALALFVGRGSCFGCRRIPRESGTPPQAGNGENYQKRNSDRRQHEKVGCMMFQRKNL